MIGFWRALNSGRVRVFKIVRQCALDFQILIIAIGAQALVALGEVLAAQSLFVNDGLIQVVPFRSRYDP